MTKAATRKKQKEVAELKRKAKAKEKLTKSGPPSKKELVDKARDSIQSQEKRKILFPTFDITKSIDKRLGEPKTYFTGRQHSTKESLQAEKRGRKNLNKEIIKEAKSKQVPAMMKKGGEVTSEYRGGGMVNLGNFKGQF